MINAATTGASLLTTGIKALDSAGFKTTSSGLCNTLASSAGLPEAAASTVCTFSKASLDRLSDAAESGVQAVAEAVEDTGEWIAEAVNSATRGAVSLYTDIANLTDSGIDAVGDAADAAIDGIGSATNTLSSLGAMAMAAGGALLSEVS